MRSTVTSVSIVANFAQIQMTEFAAAWNEIGIESSWWSGREVGFDLDADTTGLVWLGCFIEIADFATATVSDLAVIINAFSIFIAFVSLRVETLVVSADSAWLCWILIAVRSITLTPVSFNCVDTLGVLFIAIVKCINQALIFDEFTFRTRPSRILIVVFGFAFTGITFLLIETIGES